MCVLFIIIYINIYIYIIYLNVYSTCNNAYSYEDYNYVHLCVCTYADMQICYVDITLILSLIYVYN